MRPIPFTRHSLVLLDNVAAVGWLLAVVAPFLWVARLGAPELSGVAPVRQVVTEDKRRRSTLLLVREWPGCPEASDKSMVCSPSLGLLESAPGVLSSVSFAFPCCRRPWGGIRPGMPSANSKSSLQSVPYATASTSGRRRRPSHPRPGKDCKVLCSVFATPVIVACENDLGAVGCGFEFASNVGA